MQYVSTRDRTRQVSRTKKGGPGKCSCFLDDTILFLENLLEHGGKPQEQYTLLQANYQFQS